MKVKHCHLPSYFRLPKRAAKFSDYRIQMGASVLIKGKTISVGANNRFKTNPLIRQYNDFQGIHAEVSAMLSVKNKKNLEGATIVVYRETREGIPALAKPCKVCYDLMIFYKVSKVIYTTENGYTSEKIDKKREYK